MRSQQKIRIQATRRISLALAGPVVEAGVATQGRPVAADGLLRHGGERRIFHPGSRGRGWRGARDVHEVRAWLAADRRVAGLHARGAGVASFFLRPRDRHRIIRAGAHIRSVLSQPSGTQCADAWNQTGAAAHKENGRVDGKKPVRSKQVPGRQHLYVASSTYEGRGPAGRPQCRRTGASSEL